MRKAVLSPKSDTRKGASDTTTRPRSKSYNSEVLEYTTWQLLVTHQINHHPEQYNTTNAFEKKRQTLTKRALTKETASAFSAAFCIALFNDSIQVPFDQLVKDTADCPDSQFCGKAREGIVRSTIYIPFITSPGEIQKAQIKSLFDYASNDKKCPSLSTKMLIAARLELFGETEKAVFLYASLLAVNFSAHSQLANIMRIGEASPGALYYLGKYTLKKSSTIDKFKIPLINFLKTGLERIQSPDTPEEFKQIFDEFLQSTDPSWESIARTCLMLAVFNIRASHAPSALFLSDQIMNVNSTEKNPQKAFKILEYAYRRISIQDLQDKLMAAMVKVFPEVKQTQPTRDGGNITFFGHPSNLAVLQQHDRLTPAQQESAQRRSYQRTVSTESSPREEESIAGVTAGSAPGNLSLPKGFPPPIKPIPTRAQHANTVSSQLPPSMPGTARKHRRGMSLDGLEVKPRSQSAPEELDSPLLIQDEHHNKDQTNTGPKF